MNQNDGMILWILGGAGVFLIYAAYKNQAPQALLESHITGKPVDKPISNYTATQIPTVTDSDGKTWNTKPGDGEWITTDPPIPGGDPYTGKELAGLRRDITGTWYSTDTQGRIASVIPAYYQKNPALFAGTVNA